jgi:CheY-like chemotaxis protein
MAAKTISILLAEDDPDDRYLIGEALEENLVTNKLYIVEDGEELLDYLYQRGKYHETGKWPRPGLILLDLNMPRKDGREVLGEIKADPDLRRIPIVVLTTSQAEDDITYTYDQGVSGYITKPSTFSGLLETIKAIGEYWLQVVELPPE